MTLDGLVCPHCRAALEYRTVQGGAFEQCTRCTYNRLIERRIPSAVERSELERQRSRRIDARRARAARERYVA